MAILVLVAFALVALTADALAPHSAIDGFLSDRLRPPAWTAEGSPAFLLGTDGQGRDMLSRLMHGTRTSVSVALVTVLIGATIGTTLGLGAGYTGGWIDALIMRVVDAVMGLPLVMFALLFAVTMGPGFITVVLSLALISWAQYARVVRAEALSLREREFITSARAVGCSSSRIVLRYLLPNVGPTVLVLASLQVGWVVVAEASLSFLGAGIVPPLPAWGSMVASGREYMAQAPWTVFFPGLAILAFVLSVNLVGDWLRETLDPRLYQL